MIKHVLRDGSTILPLDLVTGKYGSLPGSITAQPNYKLVVFQNRGWEFIPRRTIGFNQNPIWPVSATLTSATASNSATSLTSTLAAIFTDVNFLFWFYKDFEIWGTSGSLTSSVLNGVSSIGWFQATDFDTSFSFSNFSIESLSAFSATPFSVSGMVTSADFGPSA